MRSFVCSPMPLRRFLASQSRRTRLVGCSHPMYVVPRRASFGSREGDTSWPNPAPGGASDISLRCLAWIGKNTGGRPNISARLGNGVVQRAVMRVLGDAAGPMRTGEVQAGVERLLRRPVAKESVSWSLRTGSCGATSLRVRRLCDLPTQVVNLMPPRGERERSVLRMSSPSACLPVSLVLVSLSLKEQMAQELETGLADGGAQVLRERVAREIPAALSSNGQRLSIHYWLGREAAGTGFATATLMAAELGEGARRPFEAELWYPGAALVRQLIECGYLLTLMSENRDEATAWMTSSHDGIVKKFLPRHMRRRAVRNFRPKEYEAHCDLGGHPNPVGRSLLSRHIERQELSMRDNWLDLAQHSPTPGQPSTIA
jgi:hypothetical protein